MVIFPIMPIWLMTIILVAFGMVVFSPKITVKDRKVIFNLDKKLLSKEKIIEKGIWVIIMILVFVMNMRPMIPSDSAEVVTADLDVLFVVDTTVSMQAIDGRDTTRLAQAKEDITYIIDNLPGAKFCIATVDNAYRVLTPFTPNSAIAKNLVNSLEVVDVGYANGSSLNIINDAINNTLGKYNKENRKHVVFVISDGEITEKDGKLKSFSNIKDVVDDGAVLGYGTNTGAKIDVSNMDTIYTSYISENGYLLDMSKYPKAEAISKYNERNLRSIANDLDIVFVKMNNMSDVDRILKDINKAVKKNVSDTTIYSCEDIYYIFSIIIIGLLVYQYVMFRRNQMEGVRNEK